MDISYKQLLPNITTLIFDVDGVLTNGMVTILPDGQLIRHMNTKDGFAMKSALLSGLRICIISGGKNEGVRKRLAGLGITDIYLGAHDKTKQYTELLDMYNLVPEEIMYMGDDVPDIPVMKKVGLACCPNDAVPDVQQTAKYISDKNGGEGCVRDIIEQIMRVQGKWGIDFEA